MKKRYGVNRLNDGLGSLKRIRYEYVIETNGEELHESITL